MAAINTADPEAEQNAFQRFRLITSTVYPDNKCIWYIFCLISAFGNKTGKNFSEAGMPIPGIQSAASSGYTFPYSKCDHAIINGACNNPVTGIDRVSFSENARKMAQQQNQTANSTNSHENGASVKDELPSEEAQSVDKPDSSLMELGKKSLLSMLLENLFLAELEESAADSGNAANGKNEYANEDGIQRQQPRVTSPDHSLGDNEKVAAIKKILTDVAKGKTDLSDLPKAMAGGNSSGTGKMTKNEGHSATRPASSGKEELES